MGSPITFVHVGSLGVLEAPEQEALSCDDYNALFLHPPFLVRVVRVVTYLPDSCKDMASSPPSCPVSLDSAFGPQVDVCRRAFDFTLLFEECFMSIVPSVLLLSLAPIRTYFLGGSRRKIGGSSFQILKLVSWSWDPVHLNLFH